MSQAANQRKFIARVLELEPWLPDVSGVCEKNPNPLKPHRPPASALDVEGLLEHSIWRAVSGLRPESALTDARGVSHELRSVLGGRSGAASRHIRERISKYREESLNRFPYGSLEWLETSKTYNAWNLSTAHEDRLANRVPGLWDAACDRGQINFDDVDGGVVAGDHVEYEIRVSTANLPVPAANVQPSVKRVTDQVFEWRPDMFPSSVLRAVDAERLRLLAGGWATAADAMLVVELRLYEDFGMASQMRRSILQEEGLTLVSAESQFVRFTALQETLGGLAGPGSNRRRPDPLSAAHLWACGFERRPLTAELLEVFSHSPEVAPAQVMGLIRVGASGVPRTLFVRSYLAMKELARHSAGVDAVGGVMRDRVDCALQAASRAGPEGLYLWLLSSEAGRIFVETRSIGRLLDRDAQARLGAIVANETSRW